jgi:hypothetical protein
MNHQLVAEEIEVDPMLAGATFLEPEDFAVKVACGGQVIDGNGQMKRA